MNKINIGIIGLGTVGTGVYKILSANAALLKKRLGAELKVSKIADLDITRDRGIPVDKKLLTTNAREILEDPDIQVVVELIGGIEPAKSFILQAIKNKKAVVTANKHLLAEHGLEIYQAVAKHKVDLGFEASVCGGIPIIRSLRDGLVANRILSLMGIINGTANYILTKMTDLGLPFAQVLQEAQAKGYAEADPTLDIGGIDAAHKLQILASIAYSTYIPFPSIYIEGIADITPQDIQYAKELGYTIKLLAIAKETNGALEVRVHPTMIPDEYLLASVKGVYNAVYITGDAVGATMFYGRGAGQMPTGSAIVSDLVEIAENLLQGRPARTFALPAAAKPGAAGSSEGALKMKPIDDIRSRYYLCFFVIDRPKVLSTISGILGDYNISIASVMQKERHELGTVPVVMMTHEAQEQDMKTALGKIAKLEVVQEETVCIRVEG